MAESGVPGSPESGHSGDHGGGGGGGASAREQDRFLPIANIGRIMRKAIPENGKIAKDAKESVQECVSEFISFITSELALPKPPFSLPFFLPFAYSWGVSVQGERQVPAGEEEDHQRRRSAVGDGDARLRRVRRAP